MRLQDLRIQIEQQHLIQQDLIALRPFLEILALKEEETAHLGDNKLLMVRSLGPRIVICPTHLLLHLRNLKIMLMGRYPKSTQIERVE